MTSTDMAFQEDVSPGLNDIRGLSPESDIELPEKPSSYRVGNYAPSEWSNSDEECEQYGRRRVVTHKLYKKSVPDSDVLSSSPTPEPPVVYKATVYNAKDPDSLRRQAPIAIFSDSLPLELPIVAEKTTPLRAANVTIANDGQEPEITPLRWDGSVFEVCCLGFAYFPWRIERSRSRSPTHPKQARKIIANAPLESLSFEQVSRTSIVVRSPFLYSRLKAVAGYYPSFHQTASRSLEGLTGIELMRTDISLTIRDPCGVLFHRYPELEAFVNQDPTDSAEDNGVINQATQSLAHLERDHVRHLCEFLKPRYEAEIRPCIEQLHEKSPSILFDQLWLVFEPGTDVYIQIGTSFQACVVAGVRLNDEANDGGSTSTQALQGDPVFWTLDLWYLESDGKTIGRVRTTRRIDVYKGPRELTSLAICPASIWDAHDNSERRNMIMERSRLIFKSLRQGYLLARYNGPIIGSTQNVSTLPEIRLL